MAKGKEILWGDALELSVAVRERVERRSRSWIYRIGVELEGGWTTLPRGVPQLQVDRSVQFPAVVDANGNRVLLHSGELPSAPMDQKGIEAWMRLSYPQKVNQTCGMHVHMSFTNALVYQRLMDPRFGPTVVEEFTRWAKAENQKALAAGAAMPFPDTHHFWPRLKGQSEFCQFKHYADLQVTSQKDYDHHRVGCRYTVINYCYQRGTLECRLLPMMADVEQAIRAVRHLLFITNAFLLATAKREAPVKASIPVEGEKARIERRICI